MSNHTIAASRQQIAVALSQLADDSLAELREKKEDARNRLEFLSDISLSEIMVRTAGGGWTGIEKLLREYLVLTLAIDQRDVRSIIARWAFPWPATHVDRAEDHTAKAGITMAKYLLWLGKISSGALLGTVAPRMEYLKEEDGVYRGIAVDWGCGGDPFKGWLEKHGWEFEGLAFGIDQNPEALAVARTRMDKLIQAGILRSGQVRFVKADVEDLHTLPSEVLRADVHISTLLLHELTIPQQILLLLANRSASYGYLHTLHADTPWSLGLIVTYLGTWATCRKKGVPQDITDHLLTVQKSTMRETVPLRIFKEMWALVGARPRREKAIFLVCEP